MKYLRKMFNSSKSERLRVKDILFQEIMRECMSIAPKARLSQRLRSRIERLPLHERKELMGRLQQGRAPLLAICQYDNAEVVEYFIRECGADVNQKGLFEVFGDRSVHYVSPLWCAAVTGRLSVVKCLVEHGADINCISDTGSTPVRSACFMTNFDVVVYLADHGADISKPNHNGGTCLINSVQSPELCEFLLTRGADPNAVDIQQKTAIHYAIQEQRFDSTKLLLKYGSDPYLKNKFNDDALQTAAIKGAEEIVKYLIKSVPYSMRRQAEAYELLGSTIFEDNFDVQSVLKYWKQALKIREEHFCPKTFEDTGPHYNYCLEFQTINELEAAALDENEMRMQSLLICERILGNSHKETLFRIMQRGAAYADSWKYDRCLKLWLYIFELRAQTDTLIFKETCFAAQALVCLFRDMFESYRLGESSIELSFEDIFKTLHLLCSHMPVAMELMNIQPRYFKQMKNFDDCLALIIQIIYILTRLDLTEKQKEKLSRTVCTLLKLDPRSQINNSSLLHMAVTSASYLRKKLDIHDVQRASYPSVAVVEFLLNHGAPVDSFSLMNITPLYLAATQEDFRPQIVRCLLSHGAHIDRVCTEKGETPLSHLERKSQFMDCHLKHRSLTCLCAEVLKRHNITYTQEIPKTLEVFVDMH